MDSGKGSCSSPNVDDLPLSWLADRAGTDSVSCAFVGSNQALSNNVTAKMGCGSSTALRSSWIQRLKPFGSEEEPKDSHVRTHFTKDFSSCRRPNANTHTRCSSWPAFLANEEVLCQNKIASMESDKPWNGMASENSRNLRERNRRVPHVSATTGSFGFEEEKRIDGPSVPIPLEALVPCASAPIVKKSTHSGKSNANDGQFDHLAALHSDQGPFDIKTSAFKSATGFSRKPALPFLDSSDWDAKARLVSSLASASKRVDAEGASADADRRLFALPVHIEHKLMDRPRRPERVEAGFRDVGIQEPIKSFQYSPGKPGEETAFRAEVTRTITRKDKHGYLGVCHSKGSENDITTLSKAGEDMNLRRHVGDSNLQKWPVGDCFVSSTDCCYDRVSQGLCKSNTWNSFHGCAIDEKEGTRADVCGPNSKTLAAPLARSPTAEKSDAARTRITISRTETRLSRAEKMSFLEGGNKDEVLFECKPIASAQGDDFTRFPVSEIGVRDHWSSWIQLFEDSEDMQLKERVSSTAGLGEYHRSCLNHPTDFWRSDTAEKLENQASGPHKSMKASVGILSSCDLPDNDCRELQQGNSEIHSQCIHWSRVECPSADKKNQEGMKASSNMQGWNFHVSKGGAGKVAPQVQNNAFAECSNVDKTREISSTQQAWIQRWCSSVRSGAGSEQASGYSPDTNVRLSFDQPQNPPVKSSSRAIYTIPSPPKGKAEVGCSGQISRASNTEGNRNMEAAKAHTDHFMLGRSLPMGRRSIMLQGKYMVPSVEAMAIVGTRARQMHTTALQNRGSFSVWPSIEAAAENFKPKGFSDDLIFESEENMQQGGVPIAKK